jgi:hypothetical protein
VAEFLLVIVTVITTSLGAFHLGRASQKDLIDQLRQDLDAETSLSNELMGGGPVTNHPALRLVRGEE